MQGKVRSLAHRVVANDSYACLCHVSMLYFCIVWFLRFHVSRDPGNQDIYTYRSRSSTWTVFSILAFAEAFEVTHRNKKYPQNLDKTSCPFGKSWMYDLQTAKPSRKVHTWLKLGFSMMRRRLEAREVYVAL